MGNWRLASSLKRARGTARGRRDVVAVDARLHALLEHLSVVVREKLRFAFVSRASNLGVRTAPDHQGKKGYENKIVHHRKSPVRIRRTWSAGPFYQADRPAQESRRSVKLRLKQSARGSTV
jgi:hypothetical protein